MMLAVHVVSGPSLTLKDHNLIYIKLTALELNNSDRIVVVILNVKPIELESAQLHICKALFVSMELRSRL